MDKYRVLSTSMIIDHWMCKECFRPREEDEKLVGPEVPYLSVIQALVYLANYVYHEVSSTISLLTRYSSSPTQRHWNEVKIYFVILRVNEHEFVLFQSIQIIFNKLFGNKPLVKST